MSQNETVAVPDRRYHQAPSSLCVSRRISGSYRNARTRFVLGPTQEVLAFQFFHARLNVLRLFVDFVDSGALDGSHIQFWKKSPHSTRNDYVKLTGPSRATGAPRAILSLGDDTLDINVIKKNVPNTHVTSGWHWQSAFRSFVLCRSIVWSSRRNL